MKELNTEIADIEALEHGDVRAFDRIYQKYHKSVHANILKLIKSPELSAEILQDVFLSLWQNRFRIEKDQSVGSWLFVVSYNKSLNALRKKVREAIEVLTDYPIDTCDPSQCEEEAEEIYELKIQILEEAVEVLPKRKKEVFRLYRYEGYSKEDVADQLGLSLRSVNNYLKQANKSIREHIIENHPSYIQKIGSVVLLHCFLD